MASNQTTALRTPASRLASPRVVDRARLAGGLGALGLLGIVAGSVVVVAAAAHGGSRYLSPVLHTSGPSWMAGPLQGLWSGRPSSSVWLEYMLLVVLVAMLACYLVALACARRVSPKLLWTAIVAVHVVYLLSPPLLDTDIFNYEQYARMGVLHGLNPYAQLPIAASHDAAFALTTWTHMHSVYGPLFTLGTYALVPLGIAGFFWAYKVVLMLASLALLVLVDRLARRLGRDPTAAVILCGLNPVVLVYGLGGDHNDVFAMVAVLGSVALVLRRRDGAGGAAMVAAVALKASTVLLLPLSVLAAGRTRRALAGALAAAAALGAVSLIAFGAHLPAVGEQSRLVTLYSIPNALGYAVGAGGESATMRTLMEVVLLVGTVAITAWAWRSRELLAGLGWITLLTLVTTGWDMPWYLVWLLPFAALVGNRRFRIAAAVVIVWMTLQWLPMFSTAMHHAFGLSPNATVVACQNNLAEYRLGGLSSHHKPVKCRAR